MIDLEDYKKALIAGEHDNYEELYEEVVMEYSLVFKGLGEANKIAAQRLELLRKSKLYFDWFVYEVPTDHIEGFEILLEELVEELGDG